MINAEAVGQNIFVWRLRHKKSVVWVAKKAGLLKSTVWGIENMHVKCVKDPTLHALAKGLHLSISYLTTPRAEKTKLTMDEKIAILDWLEEKRRKLRLTKRDFSKMLGVSQSTYVDALTGKRMPVTFTVHRMALGFGTTVNKILEEVET